MLDFVDELEIASNAYRTEKYMIGRLVNLFLCITISATAVGITRFWYIFSNAL